MIQNVSRSLAESVDKDAYRILISIFLLAYIFSMLAAAIFTLCGILSLVRALALAVRNDSTAAKDALKDAFQYLGAAILMVIPLHVLAFIMMFF